jgi:hypothetical protein
VVRPGGRRSRGGLDETYGFAGENALSTFPQNSGHNQWARPISLRTFVSEVENSFEFVHCRTTLLSIVANFEIALRRFRKSMWDDDHLGLKGKDYNEPDYGPLLRWAFQLVKNTKSGSDSMLHRLPKTCGDVDNA